MKVVLDTNVFISSLLSPAGPPRAIIDLWKSGRVVLCLCAEILDEYVQVLARFGLAGTSELKELLELFRTRQQIEFVTIDGDLRVVTADPADDKFLECALRANASSIISGDKHLLTLKSFQDIPILKPADFLVTVAEARLPGTIHNRTPRQ